MSENIKPRTDNKPARTFHEVGPRGGFVSRVRIYSKLRSIATHSET